ncbi:hypothetical protein GJ496_008699 [Pomphorhynchus laevis]|nr:hypothetical protein GJ496_008699 [Pomphorhynchus laevis]
MCSATGGSKKVNCSSKMNEKTSDFGKKDDISKIGGVSSNNETAKKRYLYVNESTRCSPDSTELSQLTNKPI